MFVVTRNMKFAKELREAVLYEMNLPSLVTKAEGFIRRELLLNTEAEDMDSMKILIYWKDKESHENWQKSKEHQQGHIDRHHLLKEAGREPIKRKDLNATSESFEVVSVLSAE